MTALRTASTDDVARAIHYRLRQAVTRLYGPQAAESWDAALSDSAHSYARTMPHPPGTLVHLEQDCLNLVGGTL